MHKIVVVTDDAARSELVQRALQHPGLEIATANNEESTLQALANPGWSLAVVAGNVGRRHTVTTGEAVRLRQPSLPLLVLVDASVDAASLEQARARGFAHVHYLELGGLDGDDAGRLGLGELVRARALELLATGDDESSRQAFAAWIAQTAKPQAVAEATSPAEEEIIDASEHLEEVEDEDAATPPPPPQAVTEGDLEFAARMVERSRRIDFRKLLPVPDTEGPDRVAQALRHRVQVLEQNMARIAHVYGGRMAELAASAGRMARVEEARLESEAQLEAARRSAAELEQKVTQLSQQKPPEVSPQARAEIDRLTAELAAREAQHNESDQLYRGLIKQAEDAFQALREQSAKVIAEAQEQAAARERELLEQVAALERRLAEPAAAPAAEPTMAAPADPVPEQIAAREQFEQRLKDMEAEREQAARRATDLVSERDELERRVLDLEVELERAREVTVKTAPAAPTAPVIVRQPSRGAPFFLGVGAALLGAAAFLVIARQTAQPQVLIPPPLVALPPAQATVPSPEAPEPAVEMAAAPGPQPAAEPELPIDRKALRRGLQEHFEAKRWEQAILHGERLRAEAALDWEGELLLGRALLGAGKLDEARSTLENFGRRFPTNKFAPEAYFLIAEILEKKGRKKEARAYYEKVAREGAGDLKAKATARSK